jgi:hypothetical protein
VHATDALLVQEKAATKDLSEQLESLRKETEDSSVRIQELQVKEKDLADKSRDQVQLVFR